MGLRIAIACPAPPGSRTGNRRTALRWAAILRALGHEPRIVGSEARVRADLLVALHARRSAASVARFRAAHPEAPLVVALTGTDLYGDLPRGDVRARASCEAADRLVVLQRAALRDLPTPWRRKARVVHQSVARGAVRWAPVRRAVRACVLAHLRPVKEPLLPARAVRGLPARSRLEVVHVGGVLDPRLAERARREAARNPRWRWVGSRPHARAVRVLAHSHTLVVPSRSEGGPHVIGEAAVLGIPVLATRIPGNVGLLGARHPGLFPVGDVQALRRLLLRVEEDERFRARVARASRALAPLFDPRRERAAWRALLAELFAGRRGSTPQR